MAFRDDLVKRHFPGDGARLDVVLKFLAEEDIESVSELAGGYVVCSVLFSVNLTVRIQVCPHYDRWLGLKYYPNAKLFFSSQSQTVRT